MRRTIRAFQDVFAPLTRRSGAVWGLALVCRVPAAALGTPLLILMLRLSMRSTGMSYLGTDNFFRFLLRPVPLLMTLLFIGALLCGALLENCALQRALLAKGGVRLADLLSGGLTDLRRALRRGNRAAFLAALAVLPTSGALLLPAAVMTLRLPDLMIGFARNHWCGALLTALLPLLLAVLALLPALALPAYAREGCSFTESLGRTRDIPRKRRWRLRRRALLWQLFLLACAAALTALVLTVMLLAARWKGLGYARTISAGVVALTILCGLFYLIWPALQAAVLSVLADPPGPDAPVPPRVTPGSARRAAWGVLVSLALAAVLNVAVFGFSGDDSLLDVPVVMAHRGSAAAAPENTLPAFQQAIDEGADYIELDVRQSADGELMVLHDASLYRTTGVKKNVWQLTRAEIQHLDAGSWFSAEYAGTRIPTLREALLLIRDHAALNIELKTSVHDQALEERLCALLEETGLRESCIIASTDYSALQRVKKLDPELRTLYVVSVAYGRVTNLAAADAFSLRADFLSAELVRKAHGMNKAVYAWTLNSEGRMERAIRMGVDGIITDRVAAAQELLFNRYATDEVVDAVGELLMPDKADAPEPEADAGEQAEPAPTPAIVTDTDLPRQDSIGGMWP